MNNVPQPPPHPGAVLLRDFLLPREMPEAALARQIGMAPSNLCDFIKGRRHVTPELALSLADVFETEARYWMGLQADWELWRARVDALPRFADPAAGYPVTFPPSADGRSQTARDTRPSRARRRRPRPPREEGA